MNFKVAMVLAAAVILAGAGFSYGVPEAWGGNWGSGGHGSFGGGSRGGFSGGSRGFTGRSMGVRPAFRSNTYQGFRRNHITSHHLNNSHVKSYKPAKANLTSPKGYQVKGIKGVQKQSLIGKQGKQLSFKKLSSKPQFKKANFSKPNVWSHKQWGGKGWHHHDRWSRWYGPVFWPYFFGDYFCYGFWPSDCYDVYWGYGPDVIVWGAFWPSGDYYDDDPAPREAADTLDIYHSYRTPARTASSAPDKKPDTAAVAETCAGFAPGVSDLPVGKLEGIVDATPEQRNALEDLKSAVAQASEILRKACPSEPALTPVARLDAMQQRLQAMEQANVVVKGPFVHLFTLLSHEQKARLEAVTKPVQKPQQERPKKMDLANLCSSQAGFTSVPADQISSTLTLTSEQQQELDKLKAASAQASEDLKTSCPTAIPDTLDGRLDAAQQRVAALIGAVGTVRPAVRDFYASLTDEQKAALSIQGAPKNRG